MDSIDDSEIILGMVLESRKQRLQELKEEMKSLLFEEFILKQGDFMNIEVPKRNFDGMTGRGYLYKGISRTFWLTEEENKFLTKIPENKTQIETRINSFIEDFNRKKIRGPNIGPGYPRNNSHNEDCDEKIKELENEKIKELQECDLKMENYNKISGELFEKKIKEDLDYQELIDNLLKQNNEILKYFSEVEFEERFWKYISDNGGFKNGCCSKCGKVPNLSRSCYTIHLDKNLETPLGMGKILGYRQTTRYDCGKVVNNVFVSGVIKNIYCCKFLYNFEEKKMYKKGYPGNPYTFYSITGAKSTENFIPCEEYDFKTKKDLYEEIETMKVSFEARLSKLEKLLNP
jgi:hypothetical protein